MNHTDAGVLCGQFLLQTKLVAGHAHVFAATAVAATKKVAKETGTGAANNAVVKKQPVRKAATKVGPNDPCPCGSGKKYKKCCMQKDKTAGTE